jgi:hypothetical protein
MLVRADGCHGSGLSGDPNVGVEVLWCDCEQSL